MADISTELTVLASLLFLHGFFAMAETALLAARRSRLEEMAEDGDPNARAALALSDDPRRFISTVQAGITLLGTLAAAYGGATLSGKISVALARSPELAPYAVPLGIGSVVATLTLATLVLGELIPKHLALSNPERFACRLAPLIARTSRLFGPLVGSLTFAVDGFLRLFGIRRAAETPISEDEVNILIEKGLSAGVFNQAETDMVAGVLELDQLPVTALMAPRPKIVFLNADDAPEVNWRKIVASGHSHFPVYQSNRDQVLGMVAVKALWANQAFGLSTNLRHLMVPPLIVPETMLANQLLEKFKKTGQHLALIADEFGSVQGLVSLIDVMEAIVGDLPEKGRHEHTTLRRREDGSWIIDATLAIGELKDALDLDELDDEDDAEYQSLGGFLMTRFGRIPKAGDSLQHENWNFEVISMDRHRVDKVLVTPLTPATSADDGDQKAVG